MEEKFTFDYIKILVTSDLEQCKPLAQRHNAWNCQDQHYKKLAWLTKYFTPLTP